jgi:hypothetical protein
MIKIIVACLLCAAPASAAGEEEAFKPESLAPAYLPVNRPAQPELTAALRGKMKTLGLNNRNKTSRALLLLPRDRSGAGALSFEIEKGDRAGVYQCEALGRGETAREPREGWTAGLINGTTIYYAPARLSGGATIPGVYDIRNISPEIYDVHFLNKADEALLARTARPKKTPKKVKRRFSAVWSHWYPKNSPAMPVDMIWAADSQAGSQGQGLPAFERPPQGLTPEQGSLRARQLAADPGYYRGPYGRHGFAVHADRWEDPERLADPAYEGRPEKEDFRWRDTSGCVKLRPVCLELFNEFIAEQEGRRRRVQLEVYETPLLDGLPAEPPSAQRQEAAGGQPEN